MEAKHIIFLSALVLGVPLGVRLASRHGWIKDACAFMLLFGTTRSDLQSIHFVSREWYRGTTRGFEICWLDFLWLILLCVEHRTRPPERSGPLPGSLLLLLSFLAYNAVNVAFSTPALYGMFELSKMLRAIMLFLTIACYVKGERELRLLVWALCGGVVYEWCSAAHARVALGGHSRVQGTLAHPNSLSMYNLIAVPVLLAVSLSDTEQRLRSACAVASVLGAISVLLTVSRNGVVTMGLLLAAVGVTCGSLRITARKLAAAACVMCVVAAALVNTWGAFEARFASEGGFDKEYNSKNREGRGMYLTLASLIISEQPAGVGLNNWSYHVSSRYGPMLGLLYASYPGVDTRPPERIRLRPNAHVDAAYAAPAHSLYAITLGETGWGGVILFGLLWARWLQMSGSFLLRRSPAFVSRFGTGAFFGMIGAFGQSFTEWEFRQTPLLFLFHILLGMVAAVYPVRPSLRLLP